MCVMKSEIQEVFAVFPTFDTYYDRHFVCICYSLSYIKQKYSTILAPLCVYEIKYHSHNPLGIQ